LAFLVTGSSGCIGAWAVALLHRLGAPVVAADITDDRRRLRYLLSDTDIEGVRFEWCDITDLESVTEVMTKAGITNIVHLAGLQVPFCRADPVLGAQVNVVGTATVLEAARRREGKVTGVSYASSLAVYGPPELYPKARVDDNSPLAPATLYGIYKQADEGIARPNLVAHFPPRVDLRLADRVQVAVDTDSLHFFDEETRVLLRTQPKRCWR